MTGLEPVAYSHGATALTGRLAQPAGAPRAAIVLFPTIANANAPMERRARLLAEAGYLAMIADFYGETPGDPAAVRALADALRADTAHYRARLATAVAALRAHPAAAGLPLAAIGYCMGGQAALEAARDGQDLIAAISFHGILETGQAAVPGAIRARLLVCHGDADPLVPRGQVIAFWEEMDRAGAQWHFHAYSGVKHGFTDPGSDARGIAAIAYDASADRQSWSAMLGLLDEILG
ncbi:dienelactone hydrolase family protein [Novosphingobium album (ex Liu et al. 2023)]|uniref:Dienelactone hydrolase family protein n=1 Tax=Novosphingobium album (ex Liu et al. 2023) TaxID=3031130 RepID=A0ABT5WKW7_9SPHN|nr:dienelactone hydrolase family protein [Novosphingobium album (ex Liu et al. 2023)]MDE8650685.1 dienelactone hydrolase family protein [Novosphingobium album (ex Liu et al. 2023)]